MSAGFNTGYALLLTIGLAICFFFYTFFTIIIESIVRFHTRVVSFIEYQRTIKSLPEVLKKRRGALPEGTPKWIIRWQHFAEPRLKKLGVNVNLWAFTLFIIVGSVGGFIIGYRLFADPVLAVFFAGLLVFVPLQFFGQTVDKETEKLKRQLPGAIRLFVAEYENNKNILTALLNTAKNMSDPMGEVLNECARSIAAGMTPEIAFKNLAKKLDFIYGSLWANMLYSAFGDSSAVGLMSGLAVKAQANVLENEKNRAQLAGPRNNAMIINILVFPAYIAISAFFPQAALFLKETPLGHVMVAIIFVSLIVGMVLNRSLSDI